MPKKRSRRAINQHDVIALATEADECASALQLAEENASEASAYHQERLAGTVRLVARDLERLRDRLTSLYDTAEQAVKS